MDKRAFFRQAGVMLLMAAGLVGERPSQAADSPTVSVLVIYHSATGNTEKMAQGLAEGAKAVSGSSVVLKRVGDVIRDDLLSADAVIVGSPVYAGSISGQVKTFLDNWGPKFGLEARSRNMLNKVGAAFVTGGGDANGKELTMVTILAALLNQQMIVISGVGGFGASATTGPTSPGINEKELADARDLGKRVAEVATLVKRGSSK